MNFKKLNIILIALILITIGAIFFIHQQNKRFEKEEKTTQIKIKPEKKIELKEEVYKILSHLKEEKLIELDRKNEKVLFLSEIGLVEKRINELASLNREVKFEIKEGKLTFKREDEEIIIPYEFLKIEEKPKLVIVIDDIGNSLELGERVLKLPNVTLSILPDLKYSLYFAKKAKEKKKDVLIHVPMEPHNFDKYNNGDTRFLKTEMGEEEIERLSDNFLNSIPYAIGANNHMGSKFTEDREKIEFFLKRLKSKKMFFLDSRTSSASVAKNVAENLGIPAFSRDIFLDHELNESKISEQLDRAIEQAMKNGYAIAIGHPHNETLNVLEKRINEIQKKVKIVPISNLVKNKRG